MVSESIWAEGKAPSQPRDEDGHVGRLQRIVTRTMSSADIGLVSAIVRGSKALGA